MRRWPADGHLLVPVIAHVCGAQLLGGSGTPVVKAGAEGLILDLTGLQPPDKNAAVVVIDVEGGIKNPNTAPVATAAK